MIDKLYVDVETNAISYYDPNFKITLVGYQEPGQNVKQVTDIKNLPLCKELHGFGNYEFFVCRSQNYPIHKFINQKLKLHLFDENKRWALGSALEFIGKLNHKFLRQQWENLKYTWASVPMEYLKPYNKLDVLAMDWIDQWFEGKYSTKQYNLLQETNQHICELSWKGLKVDLAENKKQYIYYKELTETQHHSLLEKADINWNSHEQVGKVLHKAGVKLPRTSSGQWATNKVVLRDRKDHPLVTQYLDWNHNMTLLDTFIIGLHNKIQLDGRLHPNFSFATTGRYRCSGPNLQNLPKPDKAPIRKQIIPETDDSVLYGIDWEQLEICLIAVCYNIPKLIEEIKNGEDRHQKSADKFKIPRHDAKQCNFATFYGATKYALTKHNLDPDTTGQQFINYIHSEYPDLRSIHERIKESCKTGQITNIFDRTRRSTKFTELANFLIQGPAGDLNKMMLIKTNELGRLYESRPYLDIHDELIFTVKKEEEKEYLTNVIQKSYNSIRMEIQRWFNVDFPFDLKYKIKRGLNYGELKEL